MKRYNVTLDPSKCVSYTLPDGRKFLPNRTRSMSEKDIEPFVQSGVFHVELVEDDERKSQAKNAGFRRKKPVSTEVNHEEKQTTSEESREEVTED